ncbi:MAG: hypothetical protein IAF38_22350, partial [Bacteroidia bacterium]|nr:hypothetical protein [Bacteroidia bacterium]
MKQKSQLKTSLLALSLIATGWCLGQNRWSTQTVSGNDLSPLALNNIFGTDGVLTPVGKRDIRFFAGGTHRMHLEGDPGPTYGFFGINDPLPNQRLTVTGGNINARTVTNGYMINSQFVLWHNGNVNNIFVGQFAGLTSTGTANTFTGFNSGRVSTGSSNTFSGFNAGRFNSDGNDNTYMGRQAGFAGSAIGAVNQNTMIGSGAGQNNQAARHTFVGYHAGFLQNAAGVVGNTFIGWNAGSVNIIGGENCFVGHQAGLNNTSSINTFIGFNCGTGNTTGAANTFLGTAA